MTTDTKEALYIAAVGIGFSLLAGAFAGFLFWAIWTVTH